MTMEKMLSRKTDGIGYMTFNNPERHNAVSLEMWDSVEAILQDFAADDDIRVIVITGAGGKAFVSGADISKFDNERGTREDRNRSDGKFLPRGLVELQVARADQEVPARAARTVELVDVVDLAAVHIGF